MPRRDDRDDDYDYEDRPRRRSSSNRSLWITLGVIGGVVLLTVAGCAGLFLFGFFKATQAINQTMQSFGGMAAAETFLGDLQAGRTQAAYDATSANFKSGMTRTQFDAFLAKNPILTRHGFHETTSFNAVGQPPNNKVVVRYRLHAQAIELDEELPDDEDAPPPPRPKKVTPPAKGLKAPAKGKELDLADQDVTVTLVEENGVWKVDQITLP